MKTKIESSMSAFILLILYGGLAFVSVNGTSRASLDKTSVGSSPYTYEDDEQDTYMPESHESLHEFSSDPQKLIALQRALKLRSPMDVKVTGRLDEQTRKALRAYQVENYLEVTGYPNEATLRELGIWDPAWREDPDPRRVPASLPEPMDFESPGEYGP